MSEALCAQLRLLTEPVPNAWTARRSSAMASVAGVPLAGFNTITPRAARADPGEVVELLDLVHATGLPYCLQVRPRDAGRIDPLAQERGLHFVDGLPFYALVGPPAPVALPELDIRVLRPQEASVHAVIAGLGFGLGRDLFETLVTPGLLKSPNVRAYVAMESGAAVATGLRITIGDATGIINVTTVPELRRRGYALALTARLVEDGLADGGRWSYLASTPEGVGVYQRLGFTEVERWGCWEAS